jgi:hypothetical protein
MARDRFTRVVLRLSCFFAILAITGPRSVLAASDEDDDDAIRHGLELRRQGRDREALVEFQAAYDHSKSSHALAQIGLAEQALGQWPEAEDDVSKALLDAHAPWVRKNRDALNAALAEIRRHLGTLDVLGPDGAEVLIDGQTVGVLPFTRPVRTTIGQVNVEVRKPGYLPSIRPVTIAAGVLTRERLSLQSVPVVPAGLTTPPATRETDSDVSKDESAASSPEARGPEGGGGGWHKPLAWAAAAGAAIGIGGGIATLVLRHDRLADVSNRGCTISNGLVYSQNPADGPPCAADATSASRFTVAAIALFSAAGALAIGSTILFITSPVRSDSVAVACLPNFAGLSAACYLEF